MTLFSFSIPSIVSLSLLQRQLNDIFGQIQNALNSPASQTGYWSPLIGGTLSSPSPVYTATGDTIEVWVAL